MTRVDRRRHENRRRDQDRRRKDRRAGDDRRATRLGSESSDEREVHTDVGSAVGESLLKGTISVRSRADRVAITSDGLFAYVKHAEDGRVSVIRTADNALLATLSPEGLPLEGTINAERPVPRVEPGAHARLADVASRIRSLVATGVLQKGWAKAFLAELDATTHELSAGQTRPVTHLLQNFVHQVGLFERVGILTPTQASQLRSALHGAIREIPV